MVSSFRILSLLMFVTMAVDTASAGDARPHIAIRGIYGGFPIEIFEAAQADRDHAVNAVWMGSGSLSAERIAALKKHRLQVFAEFNTMHVAGFLKEHPEAAPIGVDGKISPPPQGWQGICPTHSDYRQNRMEEFRRVLRDFDIDGIWLDYHHSHASWERAEPDLPDTCFCERCVGQFCKATETNLPEAAPAVRNRLILDRHKDAWVQWRCDVFTDWVREFRAIINDTRPRALLGTFHCPWSDTDFDGALKNKLAIDLKAQAKYIDVFSTMPYHARFAHPDDPAWISRQTAWLGQHLGIKGEPGERNQIWPIVQLSDWGENVSVEQVPAVLDHGTRRPATGVMVFRWGSLHDQTDKVNAMLDFYRKIDSK